MSEFNPSIFRAYDVRGVVGRDFDEQFAFSLGRAFAGSVKDLRAAHADYSRPAVALGSDCRASSKGLLYAFAQGLISEGVSAVNCGMGPSPQLYFTVHSGEYAGGVQITGSHNPPEYNGFKLLLDGEALSGDEILGLRTRLLALPSMALDDEDLLQSEFYQSFDARTPYIAMLSRCSSEYLVSNNLKVVIDSGNGVAGLVAPAVYRNLGCEVLELYSEPDGRFPNHHPDPSVPENLTKLRETVLETGAHLGLAFDGDADRVCAVDNQGEILFGDSILLLLSSELAKTVSNLLVLADAKCSDTVFSELQKLGVKVEMVPTGHSLIKKRMLETGAHIAGEMSGHIFFSHRFLGFDDAIHAGARILELLHRSTLSLHDLMARFPKRHATPEIHLPCPDELKFGVVKKVGAHFAYLSPIVIDGVRIPFASGFALVRASNTQPILVLRFEATSQELVEEYKRVVLPVVNKYLEDES